jgi:hypothetical protein
MVCIGAFWEGAIRLACVSEPKEPKLVESASLDTVVAGPVAALWCCALATGCAAWAHGSGGDWPTTALAAMTADQLLYGPPADGQPLQRKSEVVQVCCQHIGSRDHREARLRHPRKVED